MSWAAFTGAQGGRWSLVLAAVGAVALLAVAAVAGRGGIAALLVAGAVAGAVVSCAHGAWWAGQVRGWGEVPSAGMRFVVVEDWREGPYGYRLVVEAVEGGLPGGLLELTWVEKDPPETGTLIDVRGNVESLPAREEWARRAARAGIVGSLSAWRAEVVGWRPGPLGGIARWRARTRRRLAAIGGPGGDLLAGIVLGDRRRLAGGPVERDFRIAGLSHVLAVSGLHLGLVSALAGGLARRLRAPFWGQAASCMACGASFAALTGFQVSTVRALVMVGAVWGAWLAGRRTDTVAALSVAVCGILAHRPWAAFDVSLQLSVLAVGGLLVFADLGAAWVGPCLPGVLKKGATAVSATVVAQIATVPVTTGAFHTVSLIAPLANALVLPLVAPALGIGLCGAVACSVSDGVGHVLLRAAAALLVFAAGIGRACASVPGAAAATAEMATWSVVGMVAAVAVLWGKWPRPRTRGSARVVSAAVVVFVCAYGLGLPGSGQAGVVVLDVGQGDAIMVTDGRRAMLVDCGATETELLDALGRTGVRRLDAVVLTHAHDDHVGGFEALTGVTRVGWVGAPETDDPEGFDECREQAAQLTPRGRVGWRWLSRGDAWRVGELDVRVLWPDDPAPGRETNDTSVVLEVSRGETEIVLTGDAEKVALDEMERAGDVRDIEVLKVPHHGSANGLTASALARWAPEAAVISVGEGNRFGHPASITVEALAAAGTRAYRTDTAGDVTVTLEEEGWGVRTDRDPP